MVRGHMTNEYHPDWVSPPGETLEEMLEERGMSQAELAERTGRPKKTINEIVQGKSAITPETAIQFERVLGVPASFWLAREQHYREFLARAQDRCTLTKHIGWLDQMPVKAMIQLGWITEYADIIDQLREILQFFSIASPDQWETITATFRRSPAFQSNPVAVGAWLRQGERLAQAIECLPFDEQALRSSLTTARSLTSESFETIKQKLPDVCAHAGIALVIVPELPKTCVCGATRWVSPTKALIQLSLRYKTNDHFWFTFFHEVGHILLHGKRNTFLESDDRADDEREQEADRFAADQLIPPLDLQHFLQRCPPPYISRESVIEFAQQLGIAPGIVVGRLQHDGLLPRTNLNALKQKLT